MFTTITTPVAVFSVCHMARLFGKGRFPQESWTRMYAKSYPEFKVEMWNDAGELIFKSGPEDLEPRIWTHCPVPQGMNISQVYQNFLNRAARLLGNHCSPVDFTPCPVMKDGRFQDEAVRSAWMLYLDLAMDYYMAEVQH